LAEDAEVIDFDVSFLGGGGISLLMLTFQRLSELTPVSIVRPSVIATAKWHF